MKRIAVAVLLAAAAVQSGWAAVPGAPLPSTADVAKEAVTDINENSLLKDADDAAANGDTLGAVQLFQSAIIYAPTDPVPYQRLAQFYAKQGEAESAQEYFNIALDVAPAYAPALEGLALLDLAAGDLVGAQAQADVLVKSCGDKCPETAQVEKALSDKPVLDRRGVAN